MTDFVLQKMDVEKSALVSVGENTRIVKFTSASQIVPNIRTAFADVIRGESFFVQKQQEWGGRNVFVDVESDIPDKSILRVVRTSQVSV